MSPVGRGKSHSVSWRDRVNAIAVQNGRVLTFKEANARIPPACEPTEFWEGYLRAAVETNLSEDVLYAGLLTERLVTPQNYALLTPEERDEWDKACWRARSSGVPLSDLIADAYIVGQLE